MKFLFCTTGMLLLICCASLSAQQTRSFSQQSYERARAALDEGIRASGDATKLETLDDIKLEFSAKVVEVSQSRSPDAPYYITQADGVRILDFRGKRDYQELRTHFLGDIPLHLKEVITDKGGFTIELTSNAVYPVAESGIAESVSSAQRLFPQYLLSAALKRPWSLRWGGVGDYEGRPQNIVTFSQGEFPVALFFDAKTHRLTKAENLGDNIAFGVAAFETIFLDYRNVADVQIPFRVITKYAGRVNTDLRYTDVKFNTHPDDNLFEMPKGVELGPATGDKLSVKVSKLAPDIYYVSNGLSARGNFFLNNVFFYTQMVLVFKDYVIVIEAPRNGGLSQAVITKIKELAPDKPIRYVVLSHYHTDHLGGVRSYIAEGATVLTTPGNKAWLETIGSMQLPFTPDALSRKPRPASIETVATKRVITDGEHTVELYNLKTPHVDEMLIAYLPKEKIVFASDIAGIFAFLPDGKTLIANPTIVDFVKQIDKLGLKVDTVASGHGRVGTMDELRQAVH